MSKIHENLVNTLIWTAALVAMSLSKHLIMPGSMTGPLSGHSPMTIL